MGSTRDMVDKIKEEFAQKQYLISKGTYDKSDIERWVDDRLD